MSGPVQMIGIPNNLGINLCSVLGVSWQEQDDGQLVNLSIQFNPA